VGNSLYDRLRAIAIWPLMGLLIVGFMLCHRGFMWRQDLLGVSVVLPDVLTGYTPETLCRIYDEMGESGRHTYAISQATLDVVFPMVYGLLFGILITQLYDPRWARRLVLVPLIAFTFDLGENALTGWLAWTHIGKPSAWAWLAATCTWIKLVASTAMLLLVLLGTTTLLATRPVVEPVGETPLG
jgi:hypothetical protein